MKLIITKQELLSRLGLPLGTDVEFIEDVTMTELARSSLSQAFPKAYDNTKYFRIEDDGKLKTSELLAKCKEKFDCWSYWSDESLNKEFPPPTKATVRYFKKTQESDAETLGKSANEIDPDGGCTMREYMLMCLVYFEETGKHLDEKGWTLCTGSRLQGGYVGYGSWDPDDRQVRFYWNRPDDVHPLMGARFCVNI